MNHPAGSAPPRSDPGAGHRRQGVSHRKALRVGLGISFAVHVVAVLLYSLADPVEPGGAVPFFAPSADVRSGGGMRVIEVVPPAEGARERPSEPERLAPTEGPAVEVGPPEVADPNRGGIVAPGPTAAERLRPHLVDPRLWAPLDEALNELTLEQRLELDMAGRIAEYQDSVAVAIAENRALTDWTKTDSKGRKWGVSEGKLHLGDITLPLPFNFGTPIGRRDEFRRAAREWAEIERGKATGVIRDSWKDRAKAIRERRDRERAAAKPDTSGVR